MHQGPGPQASATDRGLNRRAVLRSAVAAGAGLAGAGVLARITLADDGPRHREPRSETLRLAMRKLWEDHITWSRLAIVSIAAGLPDQPATVDRLLRNQTDIGDAIKPFYGEAAGSQLTALLREHITTAADLLGAAKAGDTARLADARTRWYANADAIAAFLSAANPRQWPLGEMQEMMREHLDHTLAEAVARLQGDWTADIAAYDAVHVQILHMADMLTDGIVARFPERFR
jgi:hypothetical protein